MSLLFPEDFPFIPQASIDQTPLSSRNQRVQKINEPRGFYSEEHSDVSIIILHMSELLSSFVREDKPEKRADWARALADVRNSMDIPPEHEDLKFITDFSVMLEEGLQCLADKCAKLERQIEENAPFKRALKRRLENKSQLVVCDMCEAGGNKIPRASYYTHLREKHPKEYEKIAKFRCEFCPPTISALFIKEAALTAHLETCENRLEHERFVARLPQRDLSCRMCDADCATLKALAMHSAEKHPHAQILMCTGCALLFRQPEQLKDHWNGAKEKYPLSRCASDAPAALLPRSKLIQQMMARAKAAKQDKNFAFLECMQQNTTCGECGLIVNSFMALYNHIHLHHNKAAHDALMYGCLACDTKFKCAITLKGHLMRSELEEHEPCRNAGAAYWCGEMISKDLRTEEAKAKDWEKEKIKLNDEKGNHNENMIKEEEDVLPAQVDGAQRDASADAEKFDEVERKKIKIKLKRTADGVEIDLGCESPDDSMPALIHCDEKDTVD